MARYAAASTSTHEDACGEIAELMVAAMMFVPSDRAQALFRKWLPRNIGPDISEDAAITMAADAVLLAADLLLSQPSASGTTAFDRLARSRGGGRPAELAAMAALRGARFRLLRLEGSAQAAEVLLRDVISDELLRVVGADLPPLDAGTPLFVRTAKLGDGVWFLAGPATPLDPAAFAAARAHPAAGAPGNAAGARWAEAVYCHVVRHGTLDIPGLNRPGESFDADAGLDLADLFTEEGRPLFGVIRAWSELASEAVPDAALLQRTRQLAELDIILDAFAAAVLLRRQQHDALAAASERVLLVLLETVARRERSGSGSLTLEGVGRAVANEEAKAKTLGGMPDGAVALFGALRQRLGSVAGPGVGDPALERLVQRIQGLRAKTVAQGCTEQEALAAAEKVAELLDRYGLSLGELDFRAQPCEGIGIQTDRRRTGPIDACVPAIAAYFDCRVWLEHAKGTPLRYVFFGLRADVTAAQYLYDLVERAFATETDAFRAGASYARITGERRTATNSFQLGLSHGITAKLEALRLARDASRRSSSGRDLMPVKAAMVEEELAKLGLDLKSREVGRGRRVLADAFHEGEAAGQRFEVTPAITRAA